MEELLEVGATEDTIPVVCDVTSIHDLPEEVAKVLPRYLTVGLQVVVQYVHTDGQVTCGSSAYSIFMTSRDIKFKGMILMVLLSEMLVSKLFPTIFMGTWSKVQYIYTEEFDSVTVV